jgi:hypothetical protein
MKQMPRILVSSSLALLAMLSAACHPGAVVNGDPKQVGGTIAGIVRATDGSVALTTRRVTVVNTKTGEKFDGTTGPNGGYTIKVPQGTYHLDVEVRDGEMVAKRPDDTQINNGDLDSGRDFEITVKRVAP